jgi:hypothetical protein
MNDTTYEIFQEGQAYKVRITRLGSLVQVADGFASHADAASWVEQDRRLAVIKERREPMTTTRAARMTRMVRVVLGSNVAHRTRTPASRLGLIAV